VLRSARHVLLLIRLAWFGPESKRVLEARLGRPIPHLAFCLDLSRSSGRLFSALYDRLGTQWGRASCPARLHQRLLSDYRLPSHSRKRALSGLRCNAPKLSRRYERSGLITSTFHAAVTGSSMGDAPDICTGRAPAYIVFGITIVREPARVTNVKLRRTQSITDFGESSLSRG